jgi:hypothetical protein
MPWAGIMLLSSELIEQHLLGSPVDTVVGGSKVIIVASSAEYAGFLAYFINYAEIKASSTRTP